MSEVSKYTDINYRFNIKVINKVLNNKNSLFYLNFCDKSYIITL